MSDYYISHIQQKIYVLDKLLQIITTKQHVLFYTYNLCVMWRNFAQVLIELFILSYFYSFWRFKKPCTSEFVTIKPFILWGGNFMNLFDALHLMYKSKLKQNYDYEHLFLIFMTWCSAFEPINDVQWKLNYLYDVNQLVNINRYFYK